MSMTNRIKQKLSAVIAAWNGSRGLAALMAAALLFQLCPQSAQASSRTEPGATEGEQNVQTAESSGLYALSVSTGGLSGEEIRYFKVVYEDTDGVRRTEYIFPDDLADSYERAAAADDPSDHIELVEQVIKNGASLTEDLDISWAAAFMPYQTDTFLFEPIYEFGRLLRVELMMDAGQWECQGLRLYRVDELYGLKMYGYISEDCYVNFSGTLLAELEMERNGAEQINLTLEPERSKLYRMGEDSDPEFNLITEFEGSKARFSTGFGSDFMLRLDIADIYGGGIEALVGSSSKRLADRWIEECLYLTVHYRDTMGALRVVTLPAITGAVCWALENGVDASEILSGFAQQGDRILLEASLPNFAELEELTLDYGTEGTPKDGDALSLTAIALYDRSLSMTEVSFDAARAAIEPSITFEPIYFWKAGSKQGQSISAGSSGVRYAMTLNDVGVKLEHEDYTDQYLVVVSTDDIPSAGTTAEVYLTLNYMSLSGSEQRTGALSLSSMAKDFYGYLSGRESMCYLLGMQPGGTLKFVLTLKDVNYFTGASVELGTGSTDDWQMEGIQIYRLDHLSKRTVTWGDFSAGGMRSDRLYDRSHEGKMIFNAGRPVLVQNGESQTVESGTGSGVVSPNTPPEESVSWEDIRYSMTFEESCQNLNFTKAREEYEVMVRVAGNTSGSDNGDAGSKNHFYFQLIFQNGSSGYVLANQQLSADGFRSGYQETFRIATNQDYGELVSVRIIPEENLETTDSFDKLNIDSIEVVKTSTTGLSRQWVIEQVGWIDIDYRDVGAASGITGQEGRDHDDVSSAYSVSYSTYAVNLLFAITTAGTPFQGSVTADLVYYNNAGELQRKSFDVVREMYTYTNKTAHYNNATDASGNVVAAGNAISDADYMFRAGHTDRFVISVSDVAELVYMDLKAMAAGLQQGKATTWNIGGVSASLVTADGALKINANDEYERDNETQALTSNVDTGKVPAYQLILEKDTVQEAKIYFIENKIQMDTGSSWASAVSREPVSQNDTLNVYVYPDPERSEAIGNYEMKASLEYTTPYGLWQTSTGSMERAADGSMFYALGISATGMTILNQMTVKAESITGMPEAYIDHVIVQQVRSGVVINTYRMEFNGTSAVYGCTAKPETEDAESAGTDPVDMQVVKFMVGAGMQPTLLQAETKDMAVALRYTTTNDVAGSGREYNSAYIYLTDQQCMALRAGQIVELAFHEPYVREVTGVVMVATGGLSVPVDLACVGTYQKSTVSGAQVETGWYGFSAFVDGSVGNVVSRADRTMGYAGESVQKLKLTFVTAPAAENAESGTDSAVALTIAYLDELGLSRVMQIDDIRTYLTTENGFATGSTACAELLVPNMQELRWIEIRPYDDREATDVSWKLSSLIAQLGEGSNAQTEERSVDTAQPILESAPRKINLSDITVNAVAWTDTESGIPTERTTVDGKLDILVESGRTVIITPKLLGTEEGYEVKAERVSLGSNATSDAGNFLRRSGEDLIFVPERNYTGASIFYRITITSREVGTSAVVNIELLFEEKPEPETAQTGTSTEGTSTEGTATEGTATEGTVTEGTATEGTVTEGTATEGTVTEGTVTEDPTAEGTAAGSETP